MERRIVALGYRIDAQACVIVALGMLLRLLLLQAYRIVAVGYRIVAPGWLIVAVLDGAATP
jgi:hypothetical protein